MNTETPDHRKSHISTLDLWSSPVQFRDLIPLSFEDLQGRSFHSFRGPLEEQCGEGLTIHPLLVLGTTTASQRHLWLLCLQTEESSKSGDDEGEHQLGLGVRFSGRGWW